MKITKSAAIAAILLLPVAATAFAGEPVSVPEPGTFGLLAMGLGIAAAIKFKNRKK